MKKLFLILIFNLTINSVFADSPLTSTDFYKAYMDIPLVNKTSKSNGVLTNEVFDFLNSKSNSIDKKIALINALKWDFDGKNNAILYLKKLFVIHKEYTSKNFFNKASADELICYAYLKAMDNYFNVEEALKFSTQATKLNSNSYTIAIINNLIKAQLISFNEWCEIYRVMNEVREDKKLVIDFRKQASKIIFNYTDCYKEYCTNWYFIKKFIKNI
jgi:hypothetical protein